jgi:hypothetical protein
LVRSAISTTSGAAVISGMPPMRRASASGTPSLTSAAMRASRAAAASFGSALSSALVSAAIPSR